MLPDEFGVGGVEDVPAVQDAADSFGCGDDLGPEVKFRIEEFRGKICEAAMKRNVNLQAKNGRKRRGCSYSDILRVDWRRGFGRRK